MRAIVACGWFGIQCWIGGHALLPRSSSRSAPAGRRSSARTSSAATCRPSGWLPRVFWALNILIVYRGMDLLREVENWAAPYVLVMTLAARRVGGAARGRGRPRARERSCRLRASSRRLGSFWPRLRPERHRDGRLLGHALAQHAGLHALRAVAEGADRRPGRRAADDDDRSSRRWGSSSRAPPRRSSARPSGTPSISARSFESRWLVALAEFTAVIATLAHEHRRQRRLAGERFANLAPGRSPFAPAGSSRAFSATLMMPWKLLADSDRLHQRLAPRLLRRPRLDRGRPRLRLLVHPEGAAHPRRPVPPRWGVHVRARDELGGGHRHRRSGACWRGSGSSSGSCTCSTTMRGSSELSARPERTRR